MCCNWLAIEHGYPVWDRKGSGKPFAVMQTRAEAERLCEWLNSAQFVLEGV